MKKLRKKDRLQVKHLEVYGLWVRRVETPHQDPRLKLSSRLRRKGHEQRPGGLDTCNNKEMVRSDSFPEKFGYKSTFDRVDLVANYWINKCSIFAGVPKYGLIKTNIFITTKPTE